MEADTMARNMRCPVRMMKSWKPNRSVLIGPVDAVERAQQGGPLEQAVAAARLLRVLVEVGIGGRFVVERDFRAGEHLGGELDDLGLRLVQRALAGKRLYLDAAGLFQPVDQVEGL